MAFNSETASEAGKKSKRGKDKQLKQIREVFFECLDNNRDNIQKWLDEAAKDNPAKALELLLKMSRLIIPHPKHQDVEIDSEPVKINYIHLGEGKEM